jgi:hypothetical protein
VEIDDGLAIISQHARDLGYDGLILFLDELILWLASHAADVNFIAQEGQKLAKLVEAQNANRPTPIVSFANSIPRSLCNIPCIAHHLHPFAHSTLDHLTCREFL